jgi:RNA-binding protein NOB1
VVRTCLRFEHPIAQPIRAQPPGSKILPSGSHPAATLVKFCAHNTTLQAIRLYRKIAAAVIYRVSAESAIAPYDRQNKFACLLKEACDSTKENTIMATDAPQKPIHSLILDTGPLIKNAVAISTIINSAEEIFTTPAIISEIRDAATRSRVETTLMPFLKVRNPSPASYDAVVAFSKKTGDFSVLSRQDLGILALAYEVHCERNGGPWGLREAPKQPLKMRPGEEQKEEEEEGEISGEIQKDEDVQVDVQEKANEDVKNEQQQEDAKNFELVTRKSKNKNKKSDEPRPRKERGSAKHLQMKAEKEKKKQARALALANGEQPAVEQQKESAEAGEVDQSTGGVSIEEQPIEQPVLEQPEFTSSGIEESAGGVSLEELPIEQVSAQTSAPIEEKEEKTSVEETPETQQPSEIVSAQEQATEQPQAPASQQEETTVAETSVQATQEAPVEPTSEQDTLTQDLSTLNITTPPSPPVTDDDESDGDWITPSNLSTHRAIDSGLPADMPLTPQSQLDVATMTIDFAMQNVLLQMNLHLLSTNMQRIKHLVSKVLRCHACFLIVRDLTKQFCPRCGAHSSLRRVNCSTSSRGVFRLHLAKNYTVNKRGDKFSIPKPIAGTANTKWSGIGGGQGGWGRDLILSEDQKEFTKKVEEERRGRGARDLMDEEYLPGILTGDRSGGRAGGRVKVGAGRNVNSKRTR